MNVDGIVPWGRTWREYRALFGLEDADLSGGVLDCGGGPSSATAELAALEGFLADYEAGRAAGRYRAESLPRLPFANGEFGIALCSHLLFLYADRLDAAFHVASIREMCRVAGEARVFPLLGLDGVEAPCLGNVRRALQDGGLSADLVEVGYAVQRGGNRMLRVGAAGCGGSGMKPVGGHGE